MKVIDLHCDALLKLSQGNKTGRFKNDPEIDTNQERLNQGQVKVQCFAIFIEPTTHSAQMYSTVLEQVNLFYEEVLNKQANMKHIKTWEDLIHLRRDQIGAMLTLEGVDAIGNDIEKLKTLYHLGVKSVGLTWNQANLAADGAGEPRGAGLTVFGKEIVQLNNQYKVLTDVSHLSEQGFWDVMDLAYYPIASHSNARALCDHQRNLTDLQAKEMFAKGGNVHIVFYPEFIKKDGNASIPDLIKHIDHFCSLGGVHQIGFGSDFDGIGRYVSNLENAAKYQNLIEELLKHYSEDQVKGFACNNFLQYLKRHQLIETESEMCE